jgi:hypothetical protein
MRAMTIALTGAAITFFLSGAEAETFNRNAISKERMVVVDSVEGRQGHATDNDQRIGGTLRAGIESDVGGEDTFARNRHEEDRYSRDLTSPLFDKRQNQTPAPANLFDGPVLVAEAKTASETAPATSASEMDQIGEAMANPLSYLWLLFTQNDTIWYDGDIADDLGEDAKVQNSFLINPVLSVQLTDNWKTIIRPVIPINSFDTVDNVDVSTANSEGVTGVDFSRETGLGDIVLWTAFSNQYTPPYVYGFGPTIMLNTATDDQLGTGKYSAGPMGLAFSITDKWILGVIGQHWWSFAGDDDIKVRTSGGTVRVDRPDVNLTDIQPVIRYRMSPVANIGAAPNWRYNWESDQLSLPIGGGGDTLIKIGKLPVKVGFEAYYYVERDDDFGPKFQIRLLFVPVVPSPAWSRRPLF